MENLDNAYNRCEEEGFLKKQDEIDTELIKSLLARTKEGVESFKAMEKVVKYNSILFHNKYDILREIVSAFILFDKIKSSNHLCLFAHLCKKHPELELNWEDFETFRILRNQICYEGKEVSDDVWKKIRVKFDIYIRTFIKEVENKLKPS